MHQLTPQQKQFYDALLGNREAAQKLFGKADITPPASRSELVSEPHEADISCFTHVEVVTKI